MLCRIDIYDEIIDRENGVDIEITDKQFKSLKDIIYKVNSSGNGILIRAYDKDVITIRTEPKEQLKN